MEKVIKVDFRCTKRREELQELTCKVAAALIGKIKLSQEEYNQMVQRRDELLKEEVEMQDAKYRV